MLTNKSQKSRGGEFGLSAYVAPEMLLHEFDVERGFADSVIGDAWTKAEEEDL